MNNNNNNNNKKKLFVDLDGVGANIDEQTKIYKKIFPTQPFVQSQYGFFMDMPVIDGFVESINILKEHFDLWFLSAPSYKNPMCLAEKNFWIRKHFDIEMTERLILASDKSICHGDYLIDDNAFGRGQDKFVGELILFGSNKFKNWKDVMTYLLPPKSNIQPLAIFIKYNENNSPIFKHGENQWTENNNGTIDPII